MSYEPNDRELSSVSSMTASGRYEYFVDRVADWEEVWGALGPGGEWLIAIDENGVHSFPVWPHRKYAEEALATNYPKARPEELDFKAWLSEILPQFIEKGASVAVFPNRNWDVVIVEAKKLHEEVSAKVEEYE